MTAINRLSVLPRCRGGKKADIIYNPIKWASGRGQKTARGCVQCERKLRYNGQIWIDFPHS